jgi:hypothetical protein
VLLFEALIMIVFPSRPEVPHPLQPEHDLPERLHPGHLACAEAVVIITRNYDVSVASISRWRPSSAST